MHGWRGTTGKGRVRAALLTLAAHALALIWLLSDPRMAARVTAPPREPVSIAITLPPLPRPVETEPAPSPEAPAPAGEAPRREPERRPPPVEMPRPATAITLPAPEVASEETPAEPGDVNWFARAAEHAQRYVDGLAGPEPKAQPPGPKVRQSCQPRESSFKWKKDSKPTGSGALTLGWEPPPANGGLFDDMMAGRTPRSSVPDPNNCDD